MHGRDESEYLGPRGRLRSRRRQRATPGRPSIRPAKAEAGMLRRARCSVVAGIRRTDRFCTSQPACFAQSIRETPCVLHLPPPSHSWCSLAASPTVAAKHGHGHAHRTGHGHGHRRHHEHDRGGGGWFGGLLRRVGIRLQGANSPEPVRHPVAAPDRVAMRSAIDERRTADVGRYLRDHGGSSPVAPVTRP